MLNLGPISVVLNNGSYNSFPGTCRKHNGDWLAIYRSGTTHFLADSVLNTVTSSNKGQSWSAESLFFDPGSGRDARDVGLLRLNETDRLLVSYTDVLSTGHSSSNRVVTRRSDNDGSSWGSEVLIPHTFTDWAITAADPFQLPNGRILLPIYGKNTADTFRNAELWLSDDLGDSWSFLSTILLGSTGGVDANEPSVVMMPSGDLLALIRKGGGDIEFATSSDAGATWSATANAFFSEAVPKSRLFGQHLYSQGDATAERVFDTTEGSLGSWTATIVTDTSQFANYGGFIEEEDELYLLWAEEVSGSNSQLKIRRIQTLMTAFSDFLEDLIVNTIFRTGPGGIRPSGLHVALCTAAPTDASNGSNIVEPSGGAYARVAVSQSDAEWTAPASGNGQTSNVNDITFPQATANWGTITHFAICDAASGGNVLYHGALTTARTVNNGETFRFPAGDLDINHN